MSTYKYQRVLLKLSGEALMGDQAFGIDPKVPQRLAEEIKPVWEDGVQVAVVVGGGNIFRGIQGAAAGMDRAQGDNMGMLATVINALSLQDCFERNGMDCRVMSAIEMHQVCETYIRRRAIRHLEKGRIVIFAAGTGNPYFTTDTAAALRACEIDAEVLMKATKVDGIYDADPVTHPEATKFDTITYKEVLARDLKVMDATATALCHDNKMPIMVFDMGQDGVFMSALTGENVGTTVIEEEQAYTDKAKQHMDKCLEALQANFSRVRTGRANPHILDPIKVDYYGQPTPITQLAGVKVPEASMMVIEPWDKTALRSIEKAIEASDLGITPSNDGVSIRLPFPKPTEERRRELARECKDIAEEARVSIRNVRRDTNNKLDRDEELSEDEVSREKKAVQKLTDDYVKRVDAMLKEKTAEVMEI